MIGIRAIINIVILIAIGAGLAKYISKRDTRLFAILLGGFGLRTLIAILGQSKQIAHYFPYFIGDDQVYYQFALELYRGTSDWRYTAYADFLALMMHVLGEGQAALQLLNCLCYVLTAWALERICVLLDISAKAKRVGQVLLAVFPTYLFVSSSLNRDCWIVLFISWSVYCFAKGQADNKWYMTCLALLTMIPAIIFHSGVVVLLAAYIFVLVFVDRQSGKLRITKWTWLILSVSVVIVLVFLKSPLRTVWLYYLPSSISPEVIIGETQIRLDYYGYAGANYLTDLVIEPTWGAVLKYLPLRMLYFQMSPMPWDWRGLKDIFGFITDSMFYLFSIGCVVWAFVKKRDRYSVGLMYLLMSLILQGVFAYGVINAATAMRHRAKLLVLAIVVVVYTYDCWLKGKEDGKER